MMGAIAGLVGRGFLAALFLLGAIYLMVPAFQSLRFALRVTSFPSVEGVMVEHKIKSELSTRLKDEHGPSETRVTYTPWLIYSFTTPAGTVKAEEMLTAELLGYAGVGSRERAIELVEQFPRGSQVKVFYNPEDPFEAALTTSKSKRFWLYQIGYLLAGLVGLLICGWFLWGGLRKLIGVLKNTPG